MKTSKWNLATLFCPLSCTLPAPCLPCTLPFPWPWPWPWPCAALPLNALNPNPALPSLPLSSQKVAKTWFLRFSGLENLKVESCNPALPSVPCPCTLPAPCLPWPWLAYLHCLSAATVAENATPFPSSCALATIGCVLGYDLEDS